MEPKTRSELESMSVEQLSEWLEHNGIPEEFCKKFEGKRHVFFLCVCVCVHDARFFSCMNCGSVTVLAHV